MHIILIGAVAFGLVWLAVNLDMKASRRPRR